MEIDEELDILPVDPESPTPHKDKLVELQRNKKLPDEDKKNVAEALKRYDHWIQEMDDLTSSRDERVTELVGALNEYKKWIEVDLIWDSEADFLFRQRGQLKLDNSIIEEFLPKLVIAAIIPSLAGKHYDAGPKRAFAASYFMTSINRPATGAGLQVRTKDQDFAVSRTAYLRSSYDSGFPLKDTITQQISLAFVAAECKTNLDKTMFQEAIATAHDVKTAIPGSMHFVLCEWLDMTPITTKGTDIDEVIILRGKRIASNMRSGYSKSSTRKERRDEYAKYLDDNPIRVESVLRFVNHLREIFDVKEPQEGEILKRGYF